MRVRLLGPIDVLVDGAPRAVPGQRLKAVLAALALQPGRVVSTDALVDIVWGDKAPATAANTLQSHMSHLRRVLDDRGVIVARSPGYLLDVDGEATDIDIAARLIEDGGLRPDPAERETLLRDAVSLWRDRPLADLAGLAWFDLHAHRLDQLHLKARQALIDTRLALGQHQQLIPELEQLIRQHPHYEESYGQLMLAQYRAGRQADALATYQRLRQTLEDDLGLSPTQPLRDLESAILRQDPTLTLPPAPVTARRTVPAQLPAAVNGFTGRVAELSTLDGQSNAVVVISGTAGIGKTALATHWAHRIRDRFPDGQLYVNLRGFDPTRPPLPPTEAVRSFLDALEVPAQRIPSTLDAQLGLFRSLVAERRVLVVLDNARDAVQVRALLPGSPGCLTVVTSRDQLTPLIATDGATAIYLDLLDQHEAGDLLAARIGTDRTAAEPDAITDLITRCAGLPLALTITAARAQAGRALPLAALAMELRDNVLDALRAGDAATDLRAVFSWSIDAVTPSSARLFRLLGAHPGLDITAAAAASLAELPVARCRAALTELVGAQLLTEHRPGRYTFHDLLRAYAADLLADSDRPAAVHRLIDHYLHSAHAALRLAYGPPKVPVTPARAGVQPEEHPDRQAALRWLATERTVLLAVAELAASTPGCEEQAWRLAGAMTSNLCYANYWPDWVAVLRLVFEATGRVDDRLGEAYTRLGLGRALRWLGDQHDAAVEIKAAWQGFAELDDLTGQGQAGNELGLLAAGRDAVEEALAHHEHALACFRDARDRNGEAYALNNIGWCRSLLGRPEETLPNCGRALDLFRTIGDRPGQAATLDSLGHAHELMAQHEWAIGYYTSAIELFREIGNRYDEAICLSRLGDTHHAAGAGAAAREAWTRSLRLLTELDHSDSEHVRERLRTNG